MFMHDGNSHAAAILVFVQLAYFSGLEIVQIKLGPGRSPRQ